MLSIASQIAKEIKVIAMLVMDSDVGINKKVNINTLTDSRLRASVQSELVSSGDIVVNLLMANWIIYVEHGRRRGAKMPPPEPIAEWCKRRGLPSDNNTVWKICRAISEDGIAPRPVMAKAFEIMDREFDERWSDRIFEEITKELDKLFQ